MLIINLKYCEGCGGTLTDRAEFIFCSAECQNKSIHLKLLLSRMKSRKIQPRKSEELNELCQIKIK